MIGPATLTPMNEGAEVLPTGEQFSISCGTARAVVTGIGAGLRSYQVDDVPYLESYADNTTPPLGAGILLAPWPNRVRDGRWQLDGEDQQLEITEPARDNAIHGLTRHDVWKVVEHRESLIALELDLTPQPGWPVPLRNTVSYALDDHGLTITHGVTNIGDRATPFGLGVHPYPRAGRLATDDCTLQLAASTVLPLDPERLLPTGPAEPVDGTEFDFRTPRSLRGVELDTPFGGCAPGADGLVHHELRGDGDGVDIWSDPDFSWVQVYLTDSFPGRGRAVAVEPMTCPPDALNSGTDLITLQPGESWQGRWGLRPLR